jgi:Protein of unknown function (DUF3108)
MHARAAAAPAPFPPHAGARTARPRPARSIAVRGSAARSWCAGLALFAVGCASTAEALTQPSAAAFSGTGAVGLVAGESMSFAVQLAGLDVGEAALAVGERGVVDGRDAITVRSKVSTVGAARLLRAIDDESTTVIDLRSGLPLQLDTHVLLGAQETFTHAEFQAHQVIVDVRRGASAEVRSYVFAFGELAALDAHAAMAQLRGWRPAAGAQRTVWLVGGRRLWRVDLTYRGNETVGTALGNRDATRLDGVAHRARPDRSLDESRPPRTFSVWMSDDADRVPLRVSATTELGSVEIKLVEYQRP